MNAIKNKVQLWGYVGGTPEIREMENGKKLIRLSLATHETFKNLRGEWTTETQWHQLIGWEDVAEQATTALSKGVEVAVEGKLQTRSFTDKDGIRRFITEVNIKQFKIVAQQKPKSV